MSFFKEGKSSRSISTLSNNKGIQLSSYTVPFVSIYKDEQLYDSFHQFLNQQSKSKYQKECCLFLRFFTQLQQIKKKNIKERKKLIKEIYDDYVSDTGESKINTFDLHRREYDAQDTTVSSNTSSSASSSEIKFSTKEEVVNDLEQLILYKMKHEYYPRYILSKYYINQVKDYSHSQFERIGNVKKTIHFGYDPSYFEENYMIYDADYKLFRDLSEDVTLWSLNGSSKDNQIYSFLIKDSLFSKKTRLGNCVWTKLYGVINEKFEDVVRAFVPYENTVEADPAMTSHKVLDYFQYEKLEEMDKKIGDKMQKKRSIGVVNAILKLPFPYTKTRQYVSSVSINYDPEEKALEILHKPVTHRNAPLKKNQKDLVSFIYKKIKKIDEYRTQHIEIQAFDVKASSFKHIIKLTLNMRSNDMQKSISSLVKEKKKKGFPASFKNDLTVRLCMDLKEQDLTEIFETCTSLDKEGQTTNASQEG